MKKKTDEEISRNLEERAALTPEEGMGTESNRVAHRSGGKGGPRRKSKKELQISYNAPVVLTFAIVCTVALLINLATGGVSNQALFMTYRTKISDPMMYVRFFTHIIGHSDFSHLLGNMSYILLLGPLLEEKYGSKTLFKMMCVTAFITGVLNALLFPHTGLLGASGVVFSFIILSSITGLRDGKIPLTFILVVIIYLGQQIYEGLFIADNISQFGHIVGGVAGAMMGFANPRRKRRHETN